MPANTTRVCAARVAAPLRLPHHAPHSNLQATRANPYTRPRCMTRRWRPFGEMRVPCLPLSSPPDTACSPEPLPTPRAPSKRDSWAGTVAEHTANDL